VVELLVEKRVVEDVHLAVHPGGGALRIEHHDGVVVDARGAALEERGRSRSRARARRRAAAVDQDRLGEREVGVILGLAK
jgi:hypothetical protein